MNKLHLVFLYEVYSTAFTLQLSLRYVLKAADNPMIRFYNNQTKLWKRNEKMLKQVREREEES